MITAVSISLYSIAVFISCMVGFGAAKVKADGADTDTKTSVKILAFVTGLCFAFAVILQVFS